MGGRYGHTMKNGPKPDGNQIPGMMKQAEMLPKFCEKCRTSFKVHCSCGNPTVVWKIDQPDQELP